MTVLFNIPTQTAGNGFVFVKSEKILIIRVYFIAKNVKPDFYTHYKSWVLPQLMESDDADEDVTVPTNLERVIYCTLMSLHSIAQER